MGIFIPFASILKPKELQLLKVTTFLKMSLRHLTLTLLCGNSISNSVLFFDRVNVKIVRCCSKLANVLGLVLWDKKVFGTEQDKSNISDQEKATYFMKAISTVAYRIKYWNQKKDEKHCIPNMLFREGLRCICNSLQPKKW